LRRALPIGQFVPVQQASAADDAVLSLPARREGVVPYDFRRPTKLSREHVRMLQIAYGTFARRLATLLTSGLRQVCQVSLTEISQQSYEEYVTGLESQTLMVPFTAAPLAGTCVLEFSLPVALAAVDYMLGGPGGEQTSRQLTDIETTLIRSLIGQMTGVLHYSFEPILEITPELGAIEYNPQFVQAATATDAMVIGDFELVVGTERSRLTICMPLAPLLPVLVSQRPRALEGDDALSAEAATQQMRERLGDVPLEVCVEFTTLSISPARILHLTEGDLIVLNHRVGAPLTVRAGGTAYADAIAGRSGSRLAALIVDTPQETS
jgi:flagellar motor switch protein FliM